MSDAKQPTAGTPSEKISVACGGCGRPILDGGRFCPGCGRPTPPPPVFCSACGQALASGGRFCVKCGASVAEGGSPGAATPPAPVSAPITPLAAAPAPLPTPSAQATLSPTSEEILLTWNTRIRMLFNVDVWRGVLVAFGISSFLGTILFLVISKSAWALVLGAGIFGFLMAIFLLTAIVIDLFGGFRINFALTTRGVRSIAGKGAKYAARTAFWAGVLAGKPGMAGEGMLAKSEQNVFIAYEQITKVKIRPRGRTILVKGEFLDKPIRLYCTRENYPQSEAILRHKCPGKVFA